MVFRRRRGRTLALVVATAFVFLCIAAFSAPTGASHTQEATAITLGDGSGQPGANVSGYEASVTYDPDVVRVVAVAGVDFSDPITDVDDDAGRVNLTQVSTTGARDPTLARITFELVGQSTDETTLAFDEDATAIFDADSQDIFIDSYSDGRVLVEQSPTPTQSPTATPTATVASSDGGDAGDGDSGSQNTPTATPAGNGSDSGDDSSLLDSILDRSFLLGAGFVLLVVLVAGFGYYLGARNAGGSRNDW
jgi:hypothetical protein